MKNYLKADITGIIIAGGKSRRMQYTDKALLPINGKPMITYMIKTLSKQVATIIINTNRHNEQYQQLGYQVVTDELNDYQGPLAGIASVLTHVKTPYAMVVPCDVPLFPAHLGEQLMNELQKNNADICVAHDGTRTQHMFMLLRHAMKNRIEAYLSTGQRKVKAWVSSENYVTADFSQEKNLFYNINTPNDLEKLKKMIQNNGI